MGLWQCDYENGVSGYWKGPFIGTGVRHGAVRYFVSIQFFQLNLYVSNVRKADNFFLSSIVLYFLTCLPNGDVGIVGIEIFSKVLVASSAVDIPKESAP